MGCRKCRGWEDSECCLSQQSACACACHTSCDCAFCYTIELKERTSMRSASGHGKQHQHQRQHQHYNQHQHQHQLPVNAKTAAMRLTTVLRLESKAPSTTYGDSGSVSVDELQLSGSDLSSSESSSRKSSEKIRKWASRRSTTLKPLRLFAY
ncbi:hypothetical protein H4S06_005003 [Coemansia sp. BCRC 34490]|nr:hypothetical protein H4S06_005003 [Coemansia sp. BCRC 34490]